MDLGLNNKLALVTASSGGIGLAIARSLAAECAKVAVNGRTTQSVDKAIAKIRSGATGADLIPLVADNATAEGCATTIAELPSVDILVNNLGIYEAVGFLDESDADWMRMFETNIMSGVRLSLIICAGCSTAGRGASCSSPASLRSARRRRWPITVPPRPCN